MKKSRVKIPSGQLCLFVEKNFDNREILSGSYDFVTCQRPDGTYYGFGAGKCRQGNEVSAKDIQEDLSKKVSARDAEIKAIASPSSKKELTKDIDRIQALGAKTGDDITTSSIAKANKDIDQRAAEILSRMDNNEISAKELDDFIMKRNFVGDPKTAETLVIGIEQTTPRDVDGGKSYDKFLASHMAAQQLQAENPGSAKQYDYALGIKEGRVSQFTGNHARMITALTGDTVSSYELTVGLKNTAGMELRSVPANRENSFELGQRPWVKNNPELNAKVGSAKAGDRRNYNANYKEKMSKRLVNTVAAAAKDNPNLKTITLGLGKNAEARDEIVSGIEKIPGSKSRSFTYDSNGTKMQGTVIDVGGKGKTFVYDYGQSVNAREFNSGQTTKAFIEQRQRLDAGRVRSYSKASTTIKNREYVANARTGKAQTTAKALEGVSTRNLKKAVRESEMGTSKKRNIASEIMRREGRSAAPKTSAPARRSSGKSKTQLEREAAAKRGKQAERTAKQRARAEKQIQRDLKSARKDRDGIKPGTPKYVIANNKVKELNAQLEAL